ncbi:crossover junction endodeoxyribonuclease RuvC [Candidatus Phycosocius spiralis]|uniref:Crossover junction endodeoxyribonuclease RuvC n=1 Tax=Candidatus Phycosocius spiralis TaxID=2815099 RepID=A0ABQ4PTV4_9PROT|nr:crossover junction endodeoxyribonuclease RuvC [Candidatus Phycosocius spiralis]GIU66424.1 crossover junction endodeoxyribonuclease RuvC [Candidatus Phycosocius spiralis]
MSLQTVLLGIDPGLVRTGWGVIACEGAKMSWIAHGVITPPTHLALAERLGVLSQGIQDVLNFYCPTEAAVEEVFMAKNAQSALLLGHARGATLAILAHNKMRVTEYATRHIKQALVGTGGAQKEQVAFMVRRLLPQAGTVSADAADALAAALCHGTERKTNRLLKVKHP